MTVAPEAGAQCGNSARWDLSGGPPARAVPTGIGRFYRSWLIRSLARINDYLVRWAQRKYKRLNNHPGRSWRWLEGVARLSPALFAHWKIGVLPNAG